LPEALTFLRALDGHASLKMVLEATVICVDNSEFMRNGDVLPTRLQARQRSSP